MTLTEECSSHAFENISVNGARPGKTTHMVCVVPPKVEQTVAPQLEKPILFGKMVALATSVPCSKKVAKQNAK